MNENPPRYTVLFDGHCPICRKSVEALGRWDRDGILEFLSAEDPAVYRRFPHLSDSALRESIHLVGPRGRVWEGAGAVEELLSVLPRLSWLRWLFRVPLARPVARRIYRWVARNRYQLTCGRHCGDSGAGPAS